MFFKRKKRPHGATTPAFEFTPPPMPEVKSPRKEILYLCDGTKCNPCNNIYCKHTTDIRHAINFSRFTNDGLDGHIFVEREEPEVTTNMFAPGIFKDYLEEENEADHDADTSEQGQTHTATVEDAQRPM